MISRKIFEHDRVLILLYFSTVHCALFSENVDFTEFLRQNSGSKITSFLQCANLNALNQINSQRDMEISMCLHKVGIQNQIASGKLFTR